jgi:hypothetical protein
MGEDPLAATRLAISDQRVEMERTADQLRDSLDLRKRFTENPALFVGLGAGALFLVAGGPVRVAKLLRRRLFRSEPEKAYDSLPKPMQSWVDHMVGAVGPRATEARDSLAEELERWRHNPRKHGKVSKKLAKQIAEGPPGPRRAAWNAFEAGAAILTAALARKAVERFLSGEPPSGIAPLDAVGTAGGAAEPDPRHARNDATRSRGERAEYAGMSSRSRD